MTRSTLRRRTPLTCISISALALMAACNQPLDYDLRGIGGGFSTADAAAQATTEPRPAPDDRGVISYPNYQVAVASKGDTITTVAQRLNVDAAQLSSYNGIAPDAPLRSGEVIALPVRVAEPSPQTGAATTGPIRPGSVDIGALAGDAIDRSDASSGTSVETAALPPAQAPKPNVSSGTEPTRHKVERGETAYSIARLYQVPVTSLAEWNGLGPDFAIREGQFLLIPVARQAPPQPPQAETVSKPGTGSATPTPPSAAKPLPPESAAVPIAQTPEPPPVDVGERTEQSDVARMIFPVSGSIIRDYSKGRSEGIDIKAPAGTPVVAAEAGTVAAITQSAEGVPIIVIRHEPELLTVYANVTGVTVAKGAQVKRGEQIAQLRTGNDAFVHFEVRRGFDAVDPMPYLR